MTTVTEGTHLESLVGEGKKFKTVEDLARGKHESDVFISQLQRENDAARRRIQELEDSAQERIQLEDFMDEVRKISRPGEPVEPQQPIQQRDPSPPSQPDIGAIVDERLRIQRERELAQANLQYVASEVQKVYGSDYVPKLKARAQELGLSEQYLEELAMRSPKAFLSTVFPKPPQGDPNAGAPPRTTVTTSLPGDTGVRNKKYYDKLRKDNPKAWNEQTRAQMHKDAQRLGEKFFE